ncbi:MAG: hypothetical protein HY216_03065 [Candidatus Rokubacteria bacterium]|nr:hypothetical protein [Candidatus Rokubacteria bacterium]
MTVCIAAICLWNNQPLIIGASDRMLTVGDIEFEPPQTKVFPLAQHVVAMIAGDSAAMLDVARAAWTELQVSPRADVGAVANLCAQKFSELRRRRAEEEILAPIGLDIPTFLLRQREMSPTEASTLRRQLRKHSLNSRLIIGGVTAREAHIYEVGHPGRATCNDIVGFATSGYGSWHAESQFMFAKYTYKWILKRR